MKLKSLLLTTTLLSMLAWQSQTALGQTSSDPTLPQRHVDTAYPNQTGGDTHQPVNGTELQSLLDGNQLNGKVLKLGDTIELQAGTTYSGHFTLRQRTTGSGWIIIRSSSSAFDPTGIIPPGVRVNGTDANHTSQMPKIRTPDENPAITLAAGAHDYRLVGIDIGATSDLSRPSYTVWNLVLPSGDNNVSYIVFDRCYVHGNNDTGINFRRGIALNGNWMGVVDSYLSNFHDKGTDSQAIQGWGGSGPYKIYNNFLEAASENLLFGGGGGDPAPNVVPTDIEIQRNYFFKRASWIGAGYHVKNLFELKNARNVLVDGNVFESTWTDEQKQAIVLKSSNEGGACTWCVTEHVTFTNNIVRHVQNGLLIHAKESPWNPQVQPLAVNHVKIENVLFSDVTNWANRPSPTYTGQIYAIFDGVTDVMIIHTTAEGTDWILDTAGNTPNNPNLTFRDNVVERGAYGIKSTNPFTEGTSTLNQFYTPYTYQKNLLVNNSEGTGQQFDDATLLSWYPSPCPSPNQACSSGQTFVASDWNSVGFAVGGNDPAQRRSTGNYSLASTSPYKNQASDGKDIGIDQAALDAATVGAKSGIWPGGVSDDVVWTDSVGVTVNGNDLTKIGAEGWNAGAISTQTLSGDGYVEFSTAEFNTGKMCGLSHGSSSQNFTEIDYAIHLGTANTYRVYENGALKGTFGNQQPGDRYRVAVEGGVVNYYRNYGPGVPPFYTSAVAPTYPLLVDTSLNTVGATITDAVIATPPISWTNKVGVSVNDSNGLTKTGAAGWNAGANSTQTISGDGYVEFSTAEPDTGKMCGLSHDGTGAGFGEIDYAINLSSINTVRIYENGVAVTNPATGTVSFGTYAPGERYRVAVEGGVVKYYRGSSLLYTSEVAPTYPLFVDTSLNAVGATITDVVLSSWSD